MCKAAQSISWSLRKQIYLAFKHLPVFQSKVELPYRTPQGYHLKENNSLIAIKIVI